MENKSFGVRPIRLPDTNRIFRKGYYDAKITSAYLQFRGNRHDLKVKFRVAKGKCEGFQLTAVFKNVYQLNHRLSYLCKSVGITCGKLENPEYLIGKMVKLRVVPDESTYMGRRYMDHKIIRFHPVDRKKKKSQKERPNKKAFTKN